MYQIAHLGDEDDEPEFSSAMPLEEGDTFFFAPRPLRNLVLVDELDSLSPILGTFLNISFNLSFTITKHWFLCFYKILIILVKLLACRVADLAGEDTPQVYLACGRGPRSSLRALRHGLEVAEMAVSELPGSPNAVWTVRRHKDGKLYTIPIYEIK